ncbi:hypothetical protein HZZ00_11160 [Streptomyces sp. NEAU-sy36]|uniref:hypothetical protein n=1 Tax=unclassified Streptomyces TaxID=2593676 RepID=UPI0015D5F3EC|nr:MULTISPECIES: hypothetical protein [unclassified Streptomyces]QLJ01530.1 hypothetical protein HZZ00_11160 [Streptomyces sp. NEAU-sy36]
MFRRDPDKAAQRKAERDDLKAWRNAHPAEKTMNTAALMRPWPSSKQGQTSLGPIAGAHAEFVYAGARKAWTATRLAGGVLSGGMTLAAGRKNKGAAVINLTFANGAAQTYNVTGESATLRAANQYVTAFNALAEQLAAEAEQE